MRPLKSNRGQVMVLGAVTLLLLALVVFITFNVTVATHQKIAVQNYTDVKAYSMAVQEARAMNYFAYTNRAIAASYVGMANIHAYMSEAAMLADLKMAASEVMDEVAAEETAECICGPIPCQPQHCLHAGEAGIDSAMLMIDWIDGKMGQKIKKLDKPAVAAMKAFNDHVALIHASQQGVQVAIGAMLAKGSLGNLKQDNMYKAAGNTTDVTSLLTALNVKQWKDAFYTKKKKKKQILAEIVNGTRPGFTWNRNGAPATDLVLFPEPWLAKVIKATTFWIGPKGKWIITQVPGISGRSAVTSGNFPGETGKGIVVAAQDAPTDANGETLNSYDWGSLEGQWKHGAGVGMLPLMGPAGAGELLSGKKSRHDFDMGILSMFNEIHKGKHDKKLDMDRFVELDIGTKFPFHQPYVYAASSVDARVTEQGIRGPWEIATDGSGTVSLDLTGDSTAKIQLSDNNRAKAVSKAMVYYHRLGDWSDVPNLFNPFWRAKLQPMTTKEIATIVTPIDPAAAQVEAAFEALK